MKTLATYNMLSDNLSSFGEIQTAVQCFFQVSFIEQFSFVCSKQRAILETGANTVSHGGYFLSDFFFFKGNKNGGCGVKVVIKNFTGNQIAFI